MTFASTLALVHGDGLRFFYQALSPSERPSPSLKSEQKILADMGESAVEWQGAPASFRVIWTRSKSSATNFSSRRRDFALFRVVLSPDEKSDVRDNARSRAFDVVIKGITRDPSPSIFFPIKIAVNYRFLSSAPFTLQRYAEPESPPRRSGLL